jgi:hypothetical protein
MDMATMQKRYDNQTPPPDPESCGMCGKCWSHDEGYPLGGLVLCGDCYESRLLENDIQTKQENAE